MRALFAGIRPDENFSESRPGKALLVGFLLVANGAKNRAVCFCVFPVRASLVAALVLFFSGFTFCRFHRFTFL